MTELSEREAMGGRSPARRTQSRWSHRMVGAGMVGAIVLIASYVLGQTGDAPYFLPWLDASFFFGVAFACGVATPTALNLLKGRGLETRRELASESPSDRAVTWPSHVRAAKGRVEGHAEQQLLEAIERHGEITPARAALETSLSVVDADRMLGELAEKGHLEIRAREGRLFYSY